MIDCFFPQAMRNQFLSSDDICQQSAEKKISVDGGSFLLSNGLIIFQTTGHKLLKFCSTGEVFLLNFQELRDNQLAH